MKTIVKYLLSKDIDYLNEYLLLLLKEQQNINLKTDMDKHLYKTPSPHYNKKLRKEIARVKTIYKLKIK